MICASWDRHATSKNVQPKDLQSSIDVFMQKKYEIVRDMMNI